MKKDDEKIVPGIDFSHIGEEHVNKWVALSRKGGAVLASGDTIESVMQKIRDTREKFMIHRVLDPNITLSFSGIA